MTETYTAFDLASMAECASPDSADSPGARMLLSVADAVAELVAENPDSDADDLRDSIHEIADNAPDVYTYTRWQEFVDLAAWQEDLDDLGGMPDDLTAAAGIALYIIAERLASALMEDMIDRRDDEGDDETDEAV